MALDLDAARHKVGEILSRHAAAPNLVLSHGDTDHYNWTPFVLEDVTVQNIWQGGEAETYASGIFPAWLRAQEQLGAVLHRGFPAHWHNEGEPLGDGLSCGLASTFVLTVNSGGGVKNADSLVLMIEYGDFTAIFPGDAVGVPEELAEGEFQWRGQGHHGAETHRSNSAEWVEATSADVMHGCEAMHGGRAAHCRRRYPNRLVAPSAAARHPASA